jgi:hypothetical protein
MYCIEKQLKHIPGCGKKKSLIILSASQFQPLAMKRDLLTQYCKALLQA